MEREAPFIFLIASCLLRFPNQAFWIGFGSLLDRVALDIRLSKGIGWSVFGSVLDHFWITSLDQAAHPTS